MTRGDVTGCPDLEILLQEHRALLTAYGAVQRRCNALLDAQALQVQSLTAQVVRLRAALVVRDTARALSIANKHWHKETMPAVLCVGTQGPHAAVAQRVVEMVGGHFLHHDGLADGDGHGEEALEASLVAADLVICQTGCLSHGAYWRVQDHCRRTGKQCVLVAQPDATKVVRVHRPASASSADEGGPNATIPT